MTAVNTPPTVESPIADLTVDEDAPDTIIDLWVVFVDVQDVYLAYSVVLVTDEALFTSVTFTEVNDVSYLVLDYAPDANGTADITVRATDTLGLAVDDTFTVTINPVNDAPVAADDGPYAAKGGELLAVAAPGILGNDTDIESDPLTAVLVGGPAYGTLLLNPDGSFTYRPDPFYIGPDSFTYHANDGTADSNLATVTFEVAQGGTEVCGETVLYTDKLALVIPAGAFPGCAFVSLVSVNPFAGPADPEGVAALGHRYDIRIRRPDGVYLQNFNPPLTLCYQYNEEELQAAGGSPYQFQIWTSGGNSWQKLNVSQVDPVGRWVCAPVPHLSYFDLFLPAGLPGTGFAPGVVTLLPEQPAEEAYTNLGDLWLEIPRLNLELDIVGVPRLGETWDVDWLGNLAGWLEGTAFPTRAGNSVVTAHVFDADAQPGPFVHLNWLWYGDEIIVHAWGQEYKYEVRSVQQVGPGNMDVVTRHEDYPWLTLITCRGYDDATDSYRYRVVVRAIQVEIR